MPSVEYAHQFSYVAGVGGRGRPFPGLVVRVQNPENGALGIDIQGHLDTGAERSVFPGWVASAIGLVLLDGEAAQLSATVGPVHDARLHDVFVSHDVLGGCRLTVAFTLEDTARSLLGRDLLNVLQIGFRGRYQGFYVTATP